MYYYNIALHKQNTSALKRGDLRHRHRYSGSVNEGFVVCPIANTHRKICPK